MATSSNLVPHLTLRRWLLACSTLLCVACASKVPPGWVQQPDIINHQSTSACAPAKPDGKTLALLRAKAQFGQRNLVQQQHHSSRQSESYAGTEQLSWHQQQTSQQNRFGTVPARLQQTHWQGRWHGQWLHCVLLSPVQTDQATDF